LYLALRKGRRFRFILVNRLPRCMPYTRKEIEKGKKIVKHKEGTPPLMLRHYILVVIIIRACSMHGYMRYVYKVWSDNLKGRDGLQDLLITRPI